MSTFHQFHLTSKIESFSKTKSTSKNRDFMFFACLELNGSSTFPRFVASPFIMFSCFLRVSTVVSSCFEEVRRCFLSKHYVFSLISVCFFTNMFIASKPVLYPSCIGPPRTLASLFTVVSIIRSQCFVEQNSPVRLPPKPFSSQSF